MKSVVFAWLFMAQFMYFETFVSNLPASVSEFWSQLLTTRLGAALIIYGNLMGFLFACTALAISVISFPLLLDKPASSVTAIMTSVRAVLANPLVIGVWGSPSWC